MPGCKIESALPAVQRKKVHLPEKRCLQSAIHRRTIVKVEHGIYIDKKSGRPVMLLTHSGSMSQQHSGGERIWSIKAKSAMVFFI